MPLGGRRRKLGHRHHLAIPSAGSPRSSPSPDPAMAGEGGGEPSFAGQVDVQYGGQGRFFEAYIEYFGLTEADLDAAISQYA